MNRISCAVCLLLTVATPSSRAQDLDPGEAPTECDARVEFRMDADFVHPTHARIEAVDAGDLNGDGQLDLLAYGVGLVGVELLTNQGAGTFGPARSVPFESPALAVETVDLESDGDVDVLMLLQGRLDRLENLGDGTFERHRQDVPPSAASSLAVGDFNGDGRVDVAYLGSGAYQVLLQAADGSFSLLPAVPSEVEGMGILAGNFNRDGRIDLLITFPRTSVVHFLFGDGAGTFSRPDIVEMDVPRSELHLADLDGDSRDDLVTLSSDVLIALTGAAASFSSVDLLVPGHLQAVGVADFDGDGVMDLVTSSRTSAGPTVIPHVGFGDGTFVELDGIRASGDRLLGADVDADGLSDLVAIEESSVAVHRNRGVARFAPGPSFTGLGSELHLQQSVAAADFDGDGAPDVAASHKSDLGEGGVNVRWGNGDGTFQPAQFFEGYTPGVVVTGDFDADGRPDIVLGALGAKLGVSTLFNQGATFAESVVSGVSAVPAALASGDVDGDGDDDLAAAISRSGASLLISRGDGTYDVDHFRLGGEPQTIAIADLDGDGSPEVIAGHSTTGDVSVLGVSAESTLVSKGHVDITAPASYVRPVDLDADGDLDLAVADGESSLVLVVNDGGGTLAESSRVALSDAPGSTAAVDMNRDGRVDLVTANSASLTVLLQQRDGTFVPRYLKVFYETRSFIVEDFDQNGSPDILAGRVWAPEGNLFLNLSTPPEGDADGDGVRDSCQRSFIRGDCDGDGLVGGRVSDALFLLNYNFLGSIAPPCPAACDADGDGVFAGAPTDAIYLLAFGFLGGPPPPPPFPVCGRPLEREILTCKVSDACP